MAVFMTAYGLRWDVTGLVRGGGEGGAVGAMGRRGRSEFDSTYLAEDPVGRRAHRRLGVRGLRLPEPPCFARGGQHLVDLWRVGRRLGLARGAKVNQINSTWLRQESKVLFARMCVCRRRYRAPHTRSESSDSL